MSWKFQANRYLWRPSAGGAPRFSLGLPDVLQGARGWFGLHGQALPIKQLFALEGRLTSGVLSWDARDLQHHVRGQDLILDYPYSEDTPTGVECYWRPEALFGGGLAVEWWVSANTRLLDENIEWSVASDFQATSIEVGNTDDSGTVTEFSRVEIGPSVWKSTPTTWESPLAGQKVLLIELAGDAGWVVMAVAPGDQRQLQVDVAPDLNGGQRITVRSELQMGFLEKGVIRRARLWCLWLPVHEYSRDRVQEQVHAFYRSPQPLTV